MAELLRRLCLLTDEGSSEKGPPHKVLLPACPQFEDKSDIFGGGLLQGLSAFLLHKAKARPPLSFPGREGFCKHSLLLFCQSTG